MYFMLYLFFVVYVATSVKCKYFLSPEVVEKYEVIEVGENTTQLFGQDHSDLYCSSTHFPEKGLSKIKSHPRNVIVLLHTGNLEIAFGHLLHIGRSPSEWFYFLLTEWQLSRKDVRLLETFFESDLLGKYLKINSLVFIIEKRNIFQASDTQAFEIYAFKRLVVIERFSINVPIRELDLMNIYSRRRNFRNESIRAVAQPLEALIPGQITTELQGSEFRFVSGFDYDVLQFISDALNFSIVPIPGYGLIKTSSNGSLAGTAQQVLNDEADVSIISQKMLIKTKEHVEFLYPTGEFTVNAFLMRKSNNRLKDILFRAFQFSIWLTVVLAWILIAFSMWVIRAIKSRWNILTANDDEIGGHSFVWAAGTARTIGWHVRPDTLPMRLIFITGHLMALVLYNAYSAAFTSILSTDNTLMQTPQDIAKYQYRVLLDDVTRILDVVVERLEGKPLAAKDLAARQTSFSAAIPRIFSKQVAYISDPEVFYPHLRDHLQTSSRNLSSGAIEAKICNDIVQIRVAHTTFKFAWFVKKYSPLTPFINQKLLLMDERGLRQRFRSTYKRDNDVQCLRRKRSIEASEPMILTDIWTVYIILFMGNLLSVLILLTEKIVFKLVSRFIKF